MKRLYDGLIRHLEKSKAELQETVEDVEKFEELVVAAR